jgi:hypothetical protein
VLDPDHSSQTVHFTKAADAADAAAVADGTGEGRQLGLGAVAPPCSTRPSPEISAGRPDLGVALSVVIWVGLQV